MPSGDNNRKLTDTDRAEIVRQYTTRLPDGTWKGANMIAADFGVSQPTVYYVLGRAGVKTRSAKESHAHGKRCGPYKHMEQFEEPPMCACGCGQRVLWNKAKMRWRRFVVGHYTSRAPYRNRAWLERQYVTLNRSADDIAAECGVSASTICRRLKLAGIPVRDASASKVGRFGGAKNPAWKGGVTPERQRLYKAGKWVQFARSIYARDNWRCRRCNRTQSGPRTLHAHHVKSWAENAALRFDPSNLVTLCSKCHRWVHSLQNTQREFLG